MHSSASFRLALDPASQLEPIWKNANGLVIAGMLRIEVPDSDLVDENPLPYGHTAFVEEDNQLWVCRAWMAGQPLAYLTLQTSATHKDIPVLHDLRMDCPDAHSFKAVMLALVASRSDDLVCIGVDEPRQTLIHELFGYIFFDMHKNARIQWSAYARHR